MRAEKGGTVRVETVVRTFNGRIRTQKDFQRTGSITYEQFNHLPFQRVSPF